MYEMPGSTCFFSVCIRSSSVQLFDSSNDSNRSLPWSVLISLEDLRCKQIKSFRWNISAICLIVFMVFVKREHLGEWICRYPFEIYNNLCWRLLQWNSKWATRNNVRNENLFTWSSATSARSSASMTRCSSSESWKWKRKRMIGCWNDEHNAMLTGRKGMERLTGKWWTRIADTTTNSKFGYWTIGGFRVYMHPATKCYPCRMTGTCAMFRRWNWKRMSMHFGALNILKTSAISLQIKKPASKSKHASTFMNSLDGSQIFKRQSFYLSLVIWID